MKSKLLKQIRKRFEIKVIEKRYQFLRNPEYLFKDKKTGIYYSEDGFDNFIYSIGELMKRYYEFASYRVKRNNKINQRLRKKEFESI